MAFSEITDRELDLGRHLAAVRDPAFGAVVTFIGQIRDHDPEAPGEVERLEYSSHPEAGSILARIVDDLEREDVRIAASHRIGEVGVGEPALVACVASAHRSLAFEVSRELIERIKAELPIWKRQVVSDGRHNWQGLK